MSTLNIYIYASTFFQKQNMRIMLNTMPISNGVHLYRTLQQKSWSGVLGQLNINSVYCRKTFTEILGQMCQFSATVRWI